MIQFDGLPDPQRTTQGHVCSVHAVDGAASWNSLFTLTVYLPSHSSDRQCVCQHEWSRDEFLQHQHLTNVEHVIQGMTVQVGDSVEPQTNTCNLCWPPKPLHKDRSVQTDHTFPLIHHKGTVQGSHREKLESHSRKKMKICRHSRLCNGAAEGKRSGTCVPTRDR